MQGMDAVRLFLNPFSLGQRRKVPQSSGKGRHLLFAVDSSSFRCDDPVYGSNAFGFSKVVAFLFFPTEVGVSVRTK
jgi:hypothetical protein